MSCLYSSNEIRILFIQGETAFICMVLSTENTVIFVSLFLPYNATHIKKKNKEVRYANPEILDMGTCEILSSSGNLVKVYDKERCICDLIKNRKKYEISYIRQQSRNICPRRKRIFSRLIEYAVKLGVSGW